MTDGFQMAVGRVFGGTLLTQKGMTTPLSLGLTEAYKRLMSSSDLPEGLPGHRNRWQTHSLDG